MTEYPRDFGNGYKIQTVFANKTADGGYGDIYDFRSDVAREHPGAEILTGYCVVTEASGLVAAGCCDWNETVEAAIQDYEDHIVPILERDEDIELNSTELGGGGNLSRETLFSVKSGWFQDYLGVDNRTQLEELLTNSDAWDPTEILKAARRESGISGLSIGEVTEYEQDIKKKRSSSCLRKSLPYEKIRIIRSHLIWLICRIISNGRSRCLRRCFSRWRPNWLRLLTAGTTNHFFTRNA